MIFFHFFLLFFVTVFNVMVLKLNALVVVINWKISPSCLRPSGLSWRKSPARQVVSSSELFIPDLPTCHMCLQDRHSLVNYEKKNCFWPAFLEVSCSLTLFFFSKVSLTPSQRTSVIYMTWDYSVRAALTNLLLSVAYPHLSFPLSFTLTVSPFTDSLLSFTPFQT